VDTQIALVSLIVSILALSMTLVFWRKQFRPIVTASVRTVKGGNTAITYSLKIMNSGTIPAKNITIKINETEASQALGSASSVENQEKWLYSINQNPIYILQNGDATSCSFGFTGVNNSGFWIYGSKISILITYEGWFGYKYEESQLLKIQDSDSFTGHMWD
jgi:preprotein translocase subunit SecY